MQIKETNTADTRAVTRVSEETTVKINEVEKSQTTAITRGGTQPDAKPAVPQPDNINNTVPEINIPGADEHVNNNTDIVGNNGNDGKFNGQELIDNAVDSTKDWLSDLSGRLNDGIKSLSGDVDSVIENIKGYLNNPVGKATDLAGSLINNLVGLINPIGGMVGGILSGKLVDLAKGLLGNLSNKINKFLFGEEGDRTWLGKAVDAVSNVVNDVKEWALGTKEDPTWLGKIFGYGYKDGATRVNEETGNVEVFDKASKSWVVQESNEYENGAEIDDGAGNVYVYDSKTDSWSLKSDNVSDNKIN